MLLYPAWVLLPDISYLVCSSPWPLFSRWSFCIIHHVLIWIWLWTLLLLRCGQHAQPAPCPRSLEEWRVFSNPDKSVYFIPGWKLICQRIFHKNKSFFLLIPANTTGQLSHLQFSGRHSIVSELPAVALNLWDVLREAQSHSLLPVPFCSASRIYTKWH